MITKRRVVLITKRKEDVLERYEALKYIKEVGEISRTWENNKTPIMVKGQMLCEIAGYTMIEIPESLIDEDEIANFTRFCHSNGFECGEYRTGQIFDTNTERCFMCEIANHKGFRDLKFYNQHIDKAVDCIIYESENFYVTSELGALKYGYLMIVPKHHYLSVAQFPKELMPEYYEVCVDVEKMLLKAFNGKVVTFMEHGSGPSGKTSHKKSIVHAHTHVVVDFTLEKLYKDMVKLVHCEDISKAKEVHYFSYQEGSDGQLLISMNPEVYVQRQFPRQIMAEKLGFAPNQYNWRQNEFKEITDATLFHLVESLKNEEDSRIKSRTRDFVEGFLCRNSN